MRPRELGPSVSIETSSSTKGSWEFPVEFSRHINLLRLKIWSNNSAAPERQHLYTPTLFSDLLLSSRKGKHHAAANSNCNARSQLSVCWGGKGWTSS